MRTRSRFLAVLPAAAMLSAVGVLATVPAAAAPAREKGKPAAQVLSDAQRAFAAAHSVHIYGTTGSGTDRFSINAYYTGRAGSAGTLTERQGNLQFVALGSEFYARGSLIHKANPNVPAATWVRIPSTSADLRDLTSLSAIARDAFKPEGRVSPTVGTATVGTTPAVVLTDTKDHGKLYVADNGQPLPLQVTNQDGTVHFTGCNKTYHIHRPAHAITAPKADRTGRPGDKS